MRGELKAILSFGILILALHGLPSQEPVLGDLLTQAWQAEVRNDVAVASSCYARAINLHPENPLLRIKYAEMLILLDHPDEVARQLVQALEVLSKDPKAPADLKRYACDLLMGRLTIELRERRMWLGYDYEGWLYPPPISTLPIELQRKITQLVPKDWMFPQKSSEAWFLLSTGERERGLTLLKESVLEGDYRTAVHALVSRSVTKEQRTEIARSWMKDAEQTNNPFLWLVSLHLLWRTGQIDTFHANFEKALTAMKDHPNLVLELANLCEKMKWEQGYERALTFLPPSLKPSQVEDIRKGFLKALDEGDLTKVKVCVRALTDYPEYFRSTVLGSNSIGKMLGHGWHEFVFELIQLDIVPDLPYDTKSLLLKDAAFYPPRFSHWLKLFMSQPDGEIYNSTIHLLATTAMNAIDNEPERAIWLLEQGLLVFPDELRLLNPLARAYERAGYHHQAVAILKRVISQGAKAGIIDINPLSQLWDIASRHGQLPEIEAWLKEQKENLPLGYYVGVADMYERRGKPKEALQWLEEALEVARERGWLEDAEKHAQIYYMLRSPDPAVVEEALRLQKEFSRTSPLFHPDTYELRLRCLLSLGKTEEVKKVLSEAERLYPDYPFTRRVQGLAQIAVTDWNEQFESEIKRWQNLGAPNYGALVRLAYTTVKAGKANEAKQISDKLMAGQPQWQEGYLRAVEFFSRRIDAIVPFVRWVYEIAPKHHFAGWLDTVESVGGAIRLTGETSLYGSFMISSVLLLPDLEGDLLHQMMNLMQIRSNEWWNLISAEDREKLKATLTKERVNPHALNLLETQSYLLNFAGGKELRDWLKRVIKSTQPKMAQTLICEIVKLMPQITGDQLRQLISELEKADWKGVNLCPLTSKGVPEVLANKGFLNEAISLLQLALEHAPDEQKANLMAQLAKLTGKLPKPPKGAEAQDGKAWLIQARAVWMAGKLDEAKQAALKALELGLDLKEQVDALKIVANSDPELALQLISERLSKFLVSEPNSDPPVHLILLSEVLCQIAESRKDLATKVAPLIERVSNFSRGTFLNTFSLTALVHFWAGNHLRGIETLFRPLDEGELNMNLGKVLGLMVLADVPKSARDQIAKRLDDYLKNHQVSLSTLATELRDTRAINLAGSYNPYTRQPAVELAPDGLTALAQILEQRLEAAEGVIPREFLEQVLMKLHFFVSLKKPFTQERLIPDEVVNAWWKLFESSFHKAAKTPDAEKSLKQWLRQFYIERPDTAFSQTIWFEKLKKLAE